MSRKTRQGRKKQYRDPHAKREAQHYERPVASRELILRVLDDQDRPMSRDELEKVLEIDDEDGREGLRRRLRAMVRDGQLVENRRGRFGIAERMDLIAGRVQGHRDGFGFVIPEDRKEEDLFLAPRQMRTVLDGDRVLVSEEGVNRFGKRQARIIQVVERANTELVGRFFRDAGMPCIEPSNRRISREVLITDLNELAPREGDYVRATLLESDRHDPVLHVRLEEIVAAEEEPGMEVDVALRAYDIPFEWPQDVTRQAQEIPEQVSAEAIQGRVDLRKLPLVTIDDETARDFDDAVFVEKRWRGGWRLIVAIADVSHYVHPDSPLDREGHRRGNSVYFPNRVVPMLPEKLSNGLCSLNPDVDRLCLFCEMTVSARGRISKFSFGEGVIRSAHRLTYTQVGAMLEEPESETARQAFEETDGAVQKMLYEYHDLYRALRRQREARGAVDVETVETRILYDDQKKIRAIEPVHRNVAHVMIEEAMLAANICAARLLEKAQVPALFRNHPHPPVEKLQSLQQFLGGLGLSLNWSEQDGEPEPRVFQQLAEDIAERPDRDLIQIMMLRSMSQACYEAENHGHFGLAYRAYTHFTSPIRRYPDLLVHRALRYLIRRKDWKEHVQNPGKLPPLRREVILPWQQHHMVELGEHCSMTERRADDATRDVEQWLKCQYMEEHVGDEFDGVVAAVTGFGLFVQLSDLYIDGLVHVSNLESDYYHHDEVRHALVGRSSGREFRLGDPVRVQVAAVHVEDRKIDLVMVEGGVTRRQRRGGSRRHRGQAGRQEAASAGKGGRKKSAAKKATGRKSTGGKAPARKKGASRGGRRRR